MRISQLAYWFLIVSCCSATMLHGQWRGPQLSRLGPEQGLPAGVNEITQDSTGYIYFGANSGLYRYDGHTFDFYGHDPTDETSIGTGDVTNVYTARDGLVWIGLRFGGLNSFNPKTGEFRKYTLPSLPFRSVPEAHGIYEDHDGTLWVGASHFRLFAFDRSTETFTEYTPDWIDPQEDGGRLTVLSIAADRNKPNIFWLSVLDYGMETSAYSSYGIVQFDKNSKTFHAFPCHGKTRIVDTHGYLWGNVWGNWITKFDPETSRCEIFRYEYDFFGQRYGGVSFDLEQYAGAIYVATSKALLKFNHAGNSEVVVVAPGPDFVFYSLFSDRDSNLWIGTNQGAMILDPADQQIRFFSLQQFGIPSRIFPGRLAYSVPDNAVYLTQTSGSPANRIYKIPLDEEQKAEAMFFQTTSSVYGITSDHRDRLWVSMNGAIQLLDPVTGEVTATGLPASGDEPVPWLWNLKSSPEGWIGGIGHDEFLWFHADEQVLKRTSIDEFPGSDFAKSFDSGFDGFTFGKNSRVYLFSNEVLRLNLITGEKQALYFDEFINPNYLNITYVGEDHTGNIWISSVELVAKCRIVGDSLIADDIFTIKDELASTAAAELHIDHHNRVWVFTPNGMNCIDPATREVRLFSKKEGLPDPFIDPRQVLNTSDGSIATVCANGLIVFDPEALWNSKSPSDVPVVIKQIRIGGEQLESTQLVNNLSRLDLKPGQNLVDIEFQALAYPTDYRTEYSYRIQGLQDYWISIGTNKFVTLPSLSPGNYTFEVKVGSPVSNAPIKSLDIHVGTPIYLRTWFLIVAILLVIGGIIAMMQWRIRRVRKQEAMRTEINKKIAELELKALRSQMNPHFMFNSLNSIKNYILHAEPKLAAEYLSNFAHLIRMILQNSREKAITLQEELETLMLYIELEKLRFDDEFDFSCTIEDGLQLDHIKIPPMLLQPYVENAIWHGLMHKKARGHLQLQFSKDNGMIACIIEDDGVGRAAAMQMKSLSAVRYKSMGMGITKDRIEIINKMDALGIAAEITDKFDSDGIPAGTRVTIRIPGENGSLH